MISLWALAEKTDVEAYVATLVLPPHLAHLALGPFEFALQAGNVDGREPLQITYVGEGRIEEFTLHPKDHALAMIRFVCPGIDASRIHLPQDDASWVWKVSGAPPQQMRIYFAPTTQTLHATVGRPVEQEAYVSVSRGCAFIGRTVVEAYLQAWLKRLGIDTATIGIEFATPSGGIEFTAGKIAGEMLLDDDAMAEDLICFAGLDKALADVRGFVRLDLAAAASEKSGVFEDGVYMLLARRDENG